jgi:putative glutamine amidotransferase
VRRPVIGICAAVEQVAWGPWELQAALMPMPYVLSVQRAGGIALLLAPDPLLEQQPDDLLDMLDGVMMAGGTDIGPSSYGAPAEPETKSGYEGRDSFELALARRALERDIPLLGICRGMQLINVAAGGTLVQHLPDTDKHRHTPGVFGDHGVRLAPDSLAARATGAETSSVKSHHHQGVAALGDGAIASGWDEDGTIEAIELPERAFALGVLWHPEQDEQSNVVAALVAEARERMT